MQHAEKEWGKIFQGMYKKGLNVQESDIVSEIKTHRKEKRKKSTG